MLLSIIIPVYNSEKYVRHTLESIYGQPFDQTLVEVIVVNDGTPDNSMQIVNEFAVKSATLKVIEQENRGLSAARNAGLGLAQGKYIWFVDSDDWIEDGFLQKVLPLLKERNDDVFLFRTREYSEQTGEPTLERHLLSDTQIVETDLYEIMCKEVSFSPLQIYLIRRDFLEQNHLRLVEGIIHEDMEFAPRMLAMANKVTCVPLFHYNYLRRNSGSITSSPANRKYRVASLTRIMDLHDDLLKTQLRPKSKKALDMVQFWLFRKIFNFIDPEEFQEWDAELGLGKRAKAAKKRVLKHLFYHCTSLMFLRRLMFIASPKWLKSKRKGI